MRGSFRDIEHYIRAAVLFGLGLITFLVIRSVLVPKDFGLYGHFRPGSLADVAARPVAFAGRAACLDCHADVEETRKGSKHDSVNCEACHGALAAHAADPGAVRPILPDTTRLCLVCHDRKVGRPASFPQVDAQEHAGGDPCVSCHRPHHPEME